MGSKAREEVSAKQPVAPLTSYMFRCLKQQVQHLKVKKRSMATFSTHGANLLPTAMDSQLDDRCVAPTPHLCLTDASPPP